MYGKIHLVVAWLWMILIGGLLITPHGVLCIKCGVPISAAGYISDPAVMVLGLGSLAIGIVGLVGVARFNGTK